MIFQKKTQPNNNSKLKVIMTSFMLVIFLVGLGAPTVAWGDLGGSIPMTSADPSGGFGQVSTVDIG
ncbi:MAG: hypothetical protein NT091_03335, partial [Candidatus Falkowbacteria bacterium]|nr:hypothetical protein [Candidatus Falkowbacteria bacterium]